MKKGKRVWYAKDEFVYIRTETTRNNNREEFLVANILGFRKMGDREYAVVGMSLLVQEHIANWSRSP